MLSRSSHVLLEPRAMGHLLRFTICSLRVAAVPLCEPLNRARVVLPCVDVVYTSFLC